MSAYEKQLLIVWFTITTLVIAALIPIVWWAIRSGQFSDNAAAKYLPLKSGIPENGWQPPKVDGSVAVKNERVARPKRSVAVVNSDDNKESKNVQS